MTQKTYSLIAGILFALVAATHIYRIAEGGEVTANGTLVPMWVSWVALVITAILAWYGLRFGMNMNDPVLMDVIIDTPQGSRAKYKYDEKTGRIRLSKLLPLGAYFPYNFGFIPRTRGEDGDALDVMVIMDEPVFAGCVVPVRLIGVLTAQQTERNGKTFRNDRLIGVIETEYNPPEIRSLDAVGKQRLEEIEHFFISYNRMEGRTFQPTGCYGPNQALAMVKKYGISAKAA